MMKIGPIVREPILHFAVVGALLFGAERWLVGQKEITVPANLGAEEERWIEDEIAYREGLSRGLDRDDPELRALIARKMKLVLGAQVVLREPTEDELRAFFESHRDRYGDVPRIDFTHVFTAGADSETRAKELLEVLRKGASPNGLGETFSGGRRYRRRAIADLAETFGEEFVRSLEDQALGEWVVRSSRFGWHAVRIDQRTAARAPDFATAREDVLHDWRDSERTRAVSESLARLRSHWKLRNRE